MSDYKTRCNEVHHSILISQHDYLISSKFSIQLHMSFFCIIYHFLTTSVILIFVTVLYSSAF